MAAAKAAIEIHIRYFIERLLSVAERSVDFPRVYTWKSGDSEQFQSLEGGARPGGRCTSVRNGDHQCDG
jgi:hypothetical protein